MRYVENNSEITGINSAISYYYIKFEWTKHKSKGSDCQTGRKTEIQLYTIYKRHINKFKDTNRLKVKGGK